MIRVLSRGRICQAIFTLSPVKASSRRNLHGGVTVVPVADPASKYLVPEPVLELPSDTKPLDRFNELFEFVKGGIGSKRAVPSRGIRKTSWTRLFMLAQTPLQLEMVTDILPRWRERERTFRNIDAEVFARRCEDLNCPLLALRVFSNHPKYAFPLSSNLAALQLVHSLHLKYPLQETITASVLFKVSKLPITSSLPGCAMLVSACLHSHRSIDKDPRARKLADTLLPLLQELCAKTPAFTWLGTKMFEGRPKVWTVCALKRILSVLNKEGKRKEYDWVELAYEKFRMMTPLPKLGSSEMPLLRAPIQS